jgi:hypothetical protein
VERARGNGLDNLEHVRLGANVLVIRKDGISRRSRQLGRLGLWQMCLLLFVSLEEYPVGFGELERLNDTLSSRQRLGRLLAYTTSFEGFDSLSRPLDCKPGVVVVRGDVRVVEFFEFSLAFLFQKKLSGATRQKLEDIFTSLVLADSLPARPSSPRSESTCHAKQSPQTCLSG